MNLAKISTLIRKYAKSNNVYTQNVYDMYFFEKLLYRISLSEYKELFVFKGGFLLETILGINARTTMDIDFKVNFTIDNDNIISVFGAICDLDCKDGIRYKIVRIEDIMKKEKYTGKSVTIKANLANITKYFSIDIAVGDVVTPHPILYKYISKIDKLEFEILSYNKETIIAEKIQSIISKGASGSRAKDLYDIYLLSNEKINTEYLKSALKNTFSSRGTTYNISYIQQKIAEIKNSEYQKKLFENFTSKSQYAEKITFKEAVAIFEKMSCYVEK